MLHTLLGLLLAVAGGPSAEHQRGVDLYKERKYAEAVAVLEQAAKGEDPRSGEFRESALLIGQSYFQLSQAPQSIPWLERVPEANEANYMLGYAYLQIREEAKSRGAFARLFGVAAESAAGHLVAGQMMLKKDFAEQALEEVNQAIALDAKLPQAHFLLAEIEMSKGRVDEAIAALNQELERNPSFSMAWYRRGDAYNRLEKWDAAIPDLQRAAWLNPDFSGPFILLGKCYFKKGDYINAEGILRRALKLDPRNASALYLLGQTLMLEGRKDEGRSVLEQWKTTHEPPG